MTQGVSANFAPHFAPSPAFVAQWIEQRFPKPQVAGPIPAEGAKRPSYDKSVNLTTSQPPRNVSDWIRYVNGRTDH